MPTIYWMLLYLGYISSAYTIIMYVQLVVQRVRNNVPLFVDIVDYNFFVYFWLGIARGATYAVMSSDDGYAFEKDKHYNRLILQIIFIGIYSIIVHL